MIGALFAHVMRARLRPRRVCNPLQTLSPAGAAQSTFLQAGYPTSPYVTPRCPLRPSANSTV